MKRGAREDIEMAIPYSTPRPQTRKSTRTPLIRMLMAGVAALTLTACDEPFDLDLRSSLGGGFDTTDATLHGAAPRPRADRRGIISYPNYQVAVARRGDTLQDLADRIGTDVNTLADYNGLRADDPLRIGEIIALPGRVAEPSAATGGEGVVQPPSNVDIAALAGNAINNASSVQTDVLAPAPAAQDAPKGQTGLEPIRHQVSRGETAFTIARLYNVSVRALAKWNGLGKEFTIRENPRLRIPPVSIDTANNHTNEVTAPGEGSVTPPPPSAAKPLPKATAAPTDTAKPATPDLAQTKPVTSTRMGYPVDGKIIRAYSKGKNNGIDIAADAGAAVKAAADGKIAAITQDAESGAKIVVIRHPDNIMTVYYNVADIKVAKDGSVKRGAHIASVPKGDSYVHFEVVRNGFDSVDPMPFLK
jgi:murein DD-endopeptidase MepM/ murein hydrolase activator NlpD